MLKDNNLRPYNRQVRQSLSWQEDSSRNRVNSAGSGEFNSRKHAIESNRHSSGARSCASHETRGPDSGIVITSAEDSSNSTSSSGSSSWQTVDRSKSTPGHTNTRRGRTRGRQWNSRGSSYSAR